MNNPIVAEYVQSLTQTQRNQLFARLSDGVRVTDPVIYDNDVYQFITVMSKPQQKKLMEQLIQPAAPVASAPVSAAPVPVAAPQVPVAAPQVPVAAQQVPVVAQAPQVVQPTYAEYVAKYSSDPIVKVFSQEPLKLAELSSREFVTIIKLLERIIEISGKPLALQKAYINVFKMQYLEIREVVAKECYNFARITDYMKSIDVIFNRIHETLIKYIGTPLSEKCISDISADLELLFKHINMLPKKGHGSVWNNLFIW